MSAGWIIRQEDGWLAHPAVGESKLCESPEAAAEHLENALATGLDAGVPGLRIRMEEDGRYVLESEAGEWLSSGYDLEVERAYAKHLEKKRRDPLNACYRHLCDVEEALEHEDQGARTRAINAIKAAIKALKAAAKKQEEGR